jgi:hypothetical protein
MTDKQNKTQEEQGSTFDFSCCGNWSRMKPTQTNGFDCARMMSKMIEMCGGMKSEAIPEEPRSSDTTV